MATVKETNQLQNLTPKDQQLYSPPQAVGLEFGIMLILVSLMGFFNPGFLGLNLSLMHLFVLSGGGTLSIWASFVYPSQVSYKINLSLGIFFLLNAVFGYLVQRAFDGNISAYVPLNRFAPGFTELGFADHLVHSFLSTVFFFEALSIKHPQVKKLHFNKGFLKYTFRLIVLALLVTLMLTAVYRIRGET
jgi:hypothetical protein